MSNEPESKFKQFLTAKKTEVEQSPAGQCEGDAVSALSKRGRPAGKRSDAAFEQVTAYIRKSTHSAVKIALLTQGSKCQFSDLVEDLLTRWLEGEQ